jgi:septal ring factor EnvC (AmiA/AmiB activator)
MNVWTAGILLTSGLSLGLFGAFATDDAKTKHARMKKEHAQVHEEHDALLRKVGKWRVEHRKALAALREIEASILEHEAELEELAEHAREHEDHSAITTRKLPTTTTAATARVTRNWPRPTSNSWKNTPQSTSRSVRSTTITIL